MIKRQASKQSRTKRSLAKMCKQAKRIETVEYTSDKANEQRRK